jgi:hypothetical protein
MTLFNKYLSMGKKMSLKDKVACFVCRCLLALTFYRRLKWNIRKLTRYEHPFTIRDYRTTHIFQSQFEHIKFAFKSITKNKQKKIDKRARDRNLKRLTHIHWHYYKKKKEIKNKTSNEDVLSLKTTSILHIS